MTIMWTDTHCHLTFPGLYENLETIIRRAAAAHVTTLVTIGTRPHDHEQVVALTQNYPEIWGVLGFHPNHADEVLDQDWPMLRQRLIREARIVAIGECGLDYHYADPDRNLQQLVFRRQLDLARELDKPVVLHIRDAHADGQTVMRDYPDLRFIVHCFTGTPEECETWLSLGAMIGITGIVTYKNAENIRQAALKVPTDRLLIETDAPFLSPEPVRKIKTNEPSFVTHTGKFLASLRGEHEDAFRRQTTLNARAFYGIPE